ncbi:hypothetical protein T310_4139 [Rasamsonia emersonii CBS 393.64]|uniref:Uncharacterized protein n=1 Tax=Rasamsonia emersonii (strain ATCC 16479 / CBS 393.64 / IMI 116815) TaxID=1408163 RepID=A0A0F4YUQ7_RASE3|nr:hypothetical protein T310_4139 [Rasamsonia emersonii CBS 393.64]KKA21830.1 hypothetical protein T310_4139 [Rasamsonia emersonii CBS 393.64]
MDGPERKHTYTSLTIKEAISKLLSTIQTIELRQGVEPGVEPSIKSHEEKRVRDAFRLIHQPRQPIRSKADERRDNYRHFLKKLNDDELVVACALGLGQTIIGYMREPLRVRLPLEVKQHERQLKSPLLQNLARKYSPKALGNAGIEVAHAKEALQQQHDISDNGQNQPTQPHQLTAPIPVSDTPVVPSENLLPSSQSGVRDLQSRPTGKDISDVERENSQELRQS